MADGKTSVQASPWRPRAFVMALIGAAWAGAVQAQQPAPVRMAASTLASDATYGYSARAGVTGPVIDLSPLPSPAGGPPPAPRPAPAPPPSQERPSWLETERVGPPYQAHGVWRVPTPEPGYEATGAAEAYQAQFAGRPTASGEAYDPRSLTAAHPTLPLPSLAQVTNLKTGQEVIVRINDRGPFSPGKLIALSQRASDVLDLETSGSDMVHVRYLGPAPRRVGAQGRSIAASPAPLAAKRGAEGFEVQVAAFAERSNAERAMNRISSLGPARLVAPTAAERGLWRLRLGPWRDRSEAATAQARLAAIGFPGAAILPVRH